MRKFRGKPGRLALQRGGHGQAGADGVVDLMGNARHQSPEGGELFGLDQRILRLPQVSQRRFGRIPGAADLAFAFLQRGLRALAIGNLFRGDVDADNFTTRAAQGMPIGDPKPLVDLVGALTGNFDANHRFTGFHD